MKKSKAISPELLNQLLGGRTKDQLAWAFEIVRDQENWANPILARIPAELKELVAEAVDYYTATEAYFEEEKSTGLLIVAADGYAKGPAGV